MWSSVQVFTVLFFGLFSGSFAEFENVEDDGGDDDFNRPWRGKSGTSEESKMQPEKTQPKERKRKLYRQGQLLINFFLNWKNIRVEWLSAI